MKALIMAATLILGSYAVADGYSNTRTKRTSETYQNQNNVRDVRGLPASTDSLHRHTADDTDPDMSTNRRSQRPMTNQIEGTKDTSPNGDPTVQKE